MIWSQRLRSAHAISYDCGQQQTVALDCCSRHRCAAGHVKIVFVPAQIIPGTGAYSTVQYSSIWGRGPNLGACQRAKGS
mgnify:CR=1 FL=1